MLSILFKILALLLVKPDKMVAVVPNDTSATRLFGSDRSELARSEKSVFVRSSLLPSIDKELSATKMTS